MNIKSQKDFFSGLMFMAVGAAFAWGATTYNVGSGARMGPGYFPLMLGVLMAVLGAVITFKSLVLETVGGDKIGAWAARRRQVDTRSDLEPARRASLGLVVRGKPRHLFWPDTGVPSLRHAETCGLCKSMQHISWKCTKNTNWIMFNCMGKSYPIFVEI